MSDANQTASYYAIESTWGETPAGSATLIEVPTTGDTLNRQKITVDRATIKSNRMGAKSRPVGISVDGETNHEFTAKDFEDILGKGVLSDSAPVAIDINAEACTTSASASTITADVGTPFTALLAAYPQYIRIAGGAQSGTNGVKKVASITSSVITLASGELTDDEAAVALDINANVYSNGADDVSFLWERQYADTSLKQWFNGLVASGATLTVNRRELVTLAVTWMGKTGQFGINSTATGYLCNVITAAGASAVTVDTGTRDLKKGQKLTIAGDATVYTLTADSGASPSSLAITPVLVEATVDNAAITLAPDPQATAGDGSPTADAGTDALNASDDVVAIYIDDLVVTECVDNLTFTFDNGQRERPCVGQRESIKFGKNRYRVTGSITLQFEDLTEYNAFQEHDTKELSIGFQDPAGNFTGVTVQAFTYDESPGPVPSGEDTDITLTLNFSAFEPLAAPFRLAAIEFLDA